MIKAQILDRVECAIEELTGARGPEADARTREQRDRLALVMLTELAVELRKDVEVERVAMRIIRREGRV